MADRSLLQAHGARMAGNGRAVVYMVDTIPIFLTVLLKSEGESGEGEAGRELYPRISRIGGILTADYSDGTDGGVKNANRARKWNFNHRGQCKFLTAKNAENATVFKPRITDDTEEDGDLMTGTEGVMSMWRG